MAANLKTSRHAAVAPEPAPTPYPFTQLDISKREIRVLRIEPGNFEGAVAVSISVVSLNDQPVFNTLSYAWGDASARCTIDLNGHEISVTVNLESALRHLRSHASGLMDVLSTLLWVDAVCIDQANTEERNSQVRLMGDVYRSANLVIVWLGNGDEQTDWLFDTLNHGQSRTALDVVGSTDRWRAHWVAETNLFCRSWWSRLWTIQEAVLPEPEPIMVCGT
ncbi:heterokaryon incompatibility protein-domain-containing protein, partial [Immersiella caudata]